MENVKYMSRENLEWLQSVQDMAYRLYATNQMPDDDYHSLDNCIDNIMVNNGVNTDEQDL